MNLLLTLATAVATFAGAATAVAATGQASGDDASPPPLADGDVSLAIENEFLIDDSVPFHQVNARTSDGIVTLSGTVDSLQQRQRAATIAASLKGVRSVINTITVRPVARTDADIRRDVERALWRDPAVDADTLAVTVDDGAVTIGGEADSWAEKEIALASASAIAGVLSVRDEVTLGFEGTRTDTEMENEIRQRLAMDVRVDAALIDVAVDGRRVALSGTVGSAEEQMRAYRNAWVAGVAAVDTDGLAVEWWAHDRTVRQGVPEVSDDDIAQAIAAAFTSDPRIQSPHPEVRVQHGVATLTGQVSNLQARRAAAEDARFTTGVRSVTNLVKVRPREPVGDATLGTRVREAFADNPRIERADIDVQVVNGTVSLTGEVDSTWDRGRIEQEAAQVDGVVSIDNYVQVRPAPPKPDWELAEDVRSQLFWNPWIGTGDIAVRVDDGIVTLDGTVDSPHERDRAAEEAFQGGATSVRNRLTVEP